MKRTVKLTLTTISAILGIFIITLSYILFIPNTTGNSEDFNLKIRDNFTIENVKDSLFYKDRLNSISSFTIASKILGYPKKDELGNPIIRSGRFEIKNGASNFHIIRKLKNGAQTPVKLTFNNLRTKDQLINKMSNSLMCDSNEFRRLLNDTSFLNKFELNPQTAVVLFIPNTYEIYWNTDAKELFERMHKEFLIFWNEERTAKLNKLGLTKAEVQTLASIVEEETNSKAERPIVAGLYLNRLKIEMPLQADPTIKFALSDFELKRIRSKHTAINSPYNTYKKTGLPPGPIRLASPSGIDAVLNSSAHNYLYMCAKETLNGEHNFASNLSEHLQNARKYQKALNELNIK